MLKRSIARLSCLLLAWSTVFPAYAAVPQTSDVPVNGPATTAQASHARVIRVSPEDYPALRDKLLREGYRPSGLRPVSDYRLAQTEYDASIVTEPPPPAKETSTPPPQEDDCLGRQHKQGGDDSFRAAVDMSQDMMPDGNNDSQSAAVLFIIVGTVVLVIWTLYVVRYLVRASMGLNDCGRWSSLTATSSYISAGKNQHARFNGMRYMFGFNDEGTDVGISAELGDADILLTEIDSLRLKGLYWLIGPMLRWNINPSGVPSYFQMEFVAGSTVHPQMGILAVAKMGLNFGSSEHFHWGINLGAMNINLHSNQGIITDLSQYYMLYGLEFGYRF